MKNQFPFFGLTAGERKELQKPFLTKAQLPPKEEVAGIVKELWKQPQRECQYFAQELAFKYHRKVEKEDIALYEYMVTHKSWWDTVDFIAANLMGAYFKRFPEQRNTYVQKWLESNNMWLQRSALLFQLKYKDQLDTALLSETIQPLLGSKAFFINKAIGWVLREYSKTNPQWVRDFVQSHELAPLSRKEALRLIN